MLRGPAAAKRRNGRLRRSTAAKVWRCRLRRPITSAIRWTCMLLRRPSGAKRRLRPKLGVEGPAAVGRPRGCLHGRLGSASKPGAASKIGAASAKVSIGFEVGTTAEAIATDEPTAPAP